MLRFLSAVPLALALLGDWSYAQTITLPELDLQNSGDCRQLAARDRASGTVIAMGCLDVGSRTWKPLGNASEMNVSLPGGTATGALTTLFGDEGRSALFGVKCDGRNGTDNTVAINKMLSALTDAQLPPGECRIKDQIIVPRGRTLRGAGATATTLYVGTDVNDRTSGVVKIGGVGSKLLDVGIDFAQPDTSRRSQLHAYPVAITALGSGGGWTIDRVRVAHATKTLDMRGEQGQSKIGVLETSFFDMGVDIDGSLDSVNIGTLRFWTYNFTPNQYQVLFDNDKKVNGGIGMVGLNTGRMDGLIIDSFFSIFYPKAIRGYYSTGFGGDPTRAGITTATINKLQLDTAGGLICEWCDFSISSAYINVGYSGYGYTGIIQHGGSLNIGQLGLSQFTTPGNNGRPMVKTDAALIQVDNLKASAKLTLSGAQVDQAAFDRTLLQVQNVNRSLPNPTVNIAALAINKANGPVYTRDVLYVPGANGTISGLSINPITSGSGTLIDAPNDNPLTILTAAQQGWKNAVIPNPKLLNVNYGFEGGSLSLPIGRIYAGGTVTSNGAVVGAQGFYIGDILRPTQVISPTGDVAAKQFGANGAIPVGKCALPAAGTDGGSTQQLVNAIRACLNTIGLSQ